MKCIRRNCGGRMRVARTCAHRGIATQDRYCDKCGVRQVFTIQAAAGDVTARTLLKRLLAEEGK